MSVFNGDRWLQEAIASVLNQTFRNFELVIVDDGSSDQSPDILKRFEMIDPRTVVITKHNSGLADSLNCGIRQARGEWIARLDADDICEPDRLEMQLRLAQSDPELVLIGTGSLMIDDAGSPGKFYNYPTNDQGLRRNLLTGRKFFAHSSAFFKTEVVRAVGGYRHRIKRAEDWDLWLRLCEVGRLACVDKQLIRYRIHSAQISNDEAGQRQKLDARIAMVSYWLRQMHLPDPVQSDDKEFTMFADWLMARIRQEKLFDYYAHISRLKEDLRCSPLTFSGIMTLLVDIMQEPRFVAKYIHSLFFGEKLAQQLAREWSGKTRIWTA